MVPRSLASPHVRFAVCLLPLKMYFHLQDAPSLNIVSIIHYSGSGSGIAFMLTCNATQEILGMPKNPVLRANVKSFTAYKKYIFRWHSLL